MPLTIYVRLLNGRYDAGGQNPGEHEWPPHPARLLCALAASALDENDWTALRWLESCPAPQVHASPEISAVARSGYVVTNRTHTEKKGHSQTWPARTNGKRTRAGVIPANGEFAVCWPGADPDDVLLAVLQRLARRVPYVGRSTSPATVIVDATIPENPQWRCWQPAEDGENYTTRIRIPYPGYTDDLRAAYADGRRAWETGRTAAYTRADTGSGDTGPAPVTGPFGDLLVFGFDRRSAQLHGRSLLSLTSALRKALMSRISTGIPAPVSGHGADDRTHVAYLALPDVGHEHADGHLLGVAVGLPATMTSDETARVLAATVDDPLGRLTIRSGYQIGLTHDPFRSSPRGLLPERWTAADRGGSRRWVTATPLMLDRHPHGKSTVLSEIAWSLQRAGYPEPKDIEVSPTAMLDGAVHRLDLTAIPVHGTRRPLMHATVTFPEPVTGPVIAGALKYFGAGLFAPVRGDR